jgi:hypothetical protein
VNIGPDEARSDVILAAAAAVLGTFLIGLVTQLPLYPRTGILGALVAVFWVFALTGLVPLLLARYRGDGMKAFGLQAQRDAWRRGLVLVAPVAAVGVLQALLVAGDPMGAALGRIGRALRSPVAAAPVYSALELVALVVGGLMLTTFLAVRGREGFRPVDMSLTQALRTFGMGCAGVALVGGLLRSLGPEVRVGGVLLEVAALVILILLADRLVPLGPTVPRGAILAPMVVIAVAHLFALGGGLLFGNPLIGLHAGGLGAGTAVVVAVLVSARNMAWAVVPLLIAVHWWPTCLSPVPISQAPGC